MIDGIRFPFYGPMLPTFIVCLPSRKVEDGYQGS